MMDACNQSEDGESSSQYNKKETKRNLREGGERGALI